MKKNRIVSLGISALMAASALPFTAAAYERGDVNHDGFIDARDASDVLQEYAALSTGGAASLSLAEGDYNGDGKINAADASDILIKYAELSTGGGLKRGAVRISDGYEASENADRLEQSEEFITAQTDFAVKLMQNCMTDENIMISPYSLMEALAMTANGAGGNTLAEMENVLGGEIGALNGALASRREALTDSEVFSSANSIWFRDAAWFTPKEEFLQLNADYYGADIYKAPFDGSTVDDINGWVDEKTNGMIPQFIKEISGEAVMYLINAAAFEGEWTKPYYSYEVYPAAFTAADGTEQTAEMMTSTEKIFIKDDNAKGFMKKYAGEKYAFAAILPDEDVSLSDYLDSLSGEKLHRLLSETVMTTIHAKLPKFTMEYEVNLNMILNNMGMKQAFTDSADLSGISNMSLKIDKVFQKTYIDVNEKGTKASAATGVVAFPSSAPTINEEVYLNRPFLYFIVDTETYIPVFMGALQSIDDAE